MGLVDTRPYGAAAAVPALGEGFVVVDLSAADPAEDALAAHRCDAGTGALVEGTVLARLAHGAPREALTPLVGLAFECAQAAGDRAAAQAWVARWRALGAPERADFAAYPEIDATSNAQPVKLRIELAAGGGEVSLDLRPVGPAPVEKLVDPGRHWIGAPGIAVAHDVTNRPARQRLTLPAPAADPATKARESLQDRVRAWRHGGPRDENSLAGLMRDAGLVLTVVLVPAGDAEVWKLEADGRARRVTVVPGGAASAPAAASLVRALREAAASGR